MCDTRIARITGCVSSYLQIDGVGYTTNGKKQKYVENYNHIVIHLHHAQSVLLSSFWTSRGHRCRPFFPPFLAINPPPTFLAINFFPLFLAISLPVGFSLSVANSRSRAFRRSICAQEEVPMDLHEYALRGARTHETDLPGSRGQPDMPPGRPAVSYISFRA